MLSLPSCLVKIKLNSLPSFLGREYFQTIPNLSQLQILLLTEPTYSLSISHQMILLALAKTGRIRCHSRINTQCTAIVIHSLATINYPTSPRLNSPTHSSHVNIQKISSLLFHQQARKSSAPENIQRLFINNPKIIKDFFACRIVLAANHQYPGNIQRLCGQQPAAAINSSNQQQQSTARTRSSNQEQQPAAAISSSNQQQSPAAATSSSNQQQQSTAAISSSN